MRAFLRWVGAAILFLLGRRRARREQEAEQQRPTEPAEPKEREVGGSRRAENTVIWLLGGTTLGAAGFIVFYVVQPDTQLLGLALGLGLVCLGASAAVAGKRVVPQETAIEERPERLDTPGEAENVERLVKEAGQGISRRGLIFGAAASAGGTLGAAALLPVASLGPRVEDVIFRTPWRRGIRVVDQHGHPITADEIEPGTFLTGFPEGASRSRELGSPIIVVQVPPHELQLPRGRAGTAPEGIIAFSKICTHAGCAVSMYRHPLYEPTQPRPALVCPCHYSTFDVRRGGAVIFGPAARDLPQLPLRLNPKRELEADGDFLDTIGPSWGGVRQRT